MRKTIRPMGRPRKINKDLPPGLYCYAGRNCYLRMSDTMRPVDLGTRDITEAKTIYWAFRKVWDEEQTQQQAADISAELEAAIKDPSQLTVAEYAKQWRLDRLPTLLRDDGEPLAAKTKRDYGMMVRNQVETHEPFQQLALANCRAKHLQVFLAQWIGSPHFYNYMRAVCSRMFQHAKDEGLLDVNPAAGVDGRPTPKRKVYIPMDHYLSITRHLADWEARACDLIYLISHRPGDVLRLQDKEPQIRYEERRGSKVVIVSFKATKNQQAIEISDQVDRPGGIEETLQWFRAFKAGQDFICIDHVIVYPRIAARYIGKPISVEYLSRRFADAVVAAGFEKGKYTLRDIRKKGLTDEARISGRATNKGGHKTEQMREYYVAVEIPQRAKSRLSVVRALKPGTGSA